MRSGLLRAALAATVLIFLVSRVGSAPFVAAVDRVTVPAVLLAVGLVLATNAVSAARWVWTARRLGLDLDLRAALPAYYRSVFLNQALPGGILGDVDRAARQGAIRAVAWERVLGQVTLLAGAGVVLLVLPSPVPRFLTAAGLGSLAVAVTVGLRWVPRGLRSLAVWQPIAWSVAAALGHLSLFLVALETVAPGVGVVPALPLLLAILVASSLPTSLAGWGPREGAAAGLFALAGLGAGTGVTVAASYGVLSLIAASPGGLLLLADAWRPREVAA